MLNDILALKYLSCFHCAFYFHDTIEIAGLSVPDVNLPKEVLAMGSQGSHSIHHSISSPDVMSEFFAPTIHHSELSPTLISAGSVTPASSTSPVTTATEKPEQAPRLFGRAVTLPMCPAPLPARSVSTANPADQTGTTAYDLLPHLTRSRRPTVPMHVVGHVHHALIASKSAPTPIAPSPIAEHVPILPHSNETEVKKDIAVSSSSQHQVSLDSAKPEGSTSSTAAAAIAPTGSHNQSPKTRYKKRKSLDSSISETDLDQQQKERNKEHARNTRLRKKAYIESLKTTLNEMVDRRDVDLRESRTKDQRQKQHRQVRFQVLQSFLEMRGKSDGRISSSTLNPIPSSNRTEEYSRWASILEDDFTMTRPSIDDVEGQYETVVHGIASTMSDPNEATMMLAKSCSFPGSTVSLNYTCDPKSFLMDNTTCVLHWCASSHDAKSRLVSAAHDEIHVFLIVVS